jgi:hypothetical protein
LLYSGLQPGDKAASPNLTALAEKPEEARPGDSTISTVASKIIIRIISINIKRLYFYIALK